MNAPLDDHDVIAHLRTALDEVTAAPSTAAVPDLRAPRPERPAGRWVAIAAAAVLVVGAVVAIGTNLRNRDDIGSADTEPPSTTAPVSEATVLARPVSWVVLASQDLVPGDLTVEECCQAFPAPGPATVMAWGAVDGIENGLLLLTTTNGTDTTPTFASNGFSAERVQELTAKVAPGSGLPFVLPDDGVTLLGVGSEGAGRLVSQTYSNDQGTVTVSVGDYRGQLTPLVTYGFHPALIPAFGVNGYRATLESGAEYVVWQMPDGQWATLDVPPAMADRMEGLLAALGPADSPVTESTVVGPNEPSKMVVRQQVTDVTGDALPPYEQAGADAAIGMAAPQFGGVAIDPAAPTRTLVVFTALWCPHCRATLPTLIGLETNESGVSGGIASNTAGAPATKVVIVETASAPDSTGAAVEVPAQGYDPADYEGWGHIGVVYVDRDAGDGSAGELATRYGVTGFPYFVLVDTDGTVLRRATGEMTADELLTFING